MARCIALACLFLLSHDRSIRLASADDGYRIIAPTAKEQPVSADLQHTEIQSALKLLAELRGVNIAFQRDVTGTLRSLQVQGVPASQVMDIVLRMHGLYAEDLGGVVIVMPVQQYIRDTRARKALQE